MIAAWSPATFLGTTGRVSGCIGWFHGTESTLSHLLTAPLDEEGLRWNRHVRQDRRLLPTRGVTISPRSMIPECPRLTPDTRASPISASAFSADQHFPGAPRCVRPVTLAPVPARSPTGWWRISARISQPVRHNLCVRGHPRHFQMTNGLPHAAHA